MRLIYLTGKTYPGSTADHHYIRQLSVGFRGVLGNDVKLVAWGDINFLDKGNVVKPLRPSWMKNSIFFFFWTLFFAGNNFKNLREIVFFSNDSYLLIILIVWRKIFKFKYRICSDWHHLFYDFRDKFIARNSDALITTSNKLKGNIIKISGVLGDKIATIYGGVDLTSYSNKRYGLKKLLGLPEDKIITGYVGLFKTFGFEKGISTIIESLKNLPDKFVAVFVGGTDSEIKEYGQYANSLGVKARCFFFGRKMGNEIAQYQMAMDILAIPYPDQPHFRESGFPMKAYEYMASGRPIIYSKLDLAEEILSDCAIGFTPDDAVDFSLKVKDIAENNFYPELVSKAYLKLGEYTWKAKASHIIDFIKQK